MTKSESKTIIRTFSWAIDEREAFSVAEMKKWEEFINWYVERLPFSLLSWRIKITQKMILGYAVIAMNEK